LFSHGSTPLQVKIQYTGFHQIDRLGVRSLYVVHTNVKNVQPCGVRDVEGIGHRVLPGGSGWPGRSGSDESAGLVEPGANE